jgi:hypothetical protein
MVDVSYDRFYALRRALDMPEEGEVARSRWEILPEAHRQSVIAMMTGTLNGRNTVLFPCDAPESEVVPW